MCLLISPTQLQGVGVKIVISQSYISFLFNAIQGHMGESTKKQWAVYLFLMVFLTSFQKTKKGEGPQIFQKCVPWFETMYVKLQPRGDFL